MYATPSFFNSTPMGRLINRFSVDTNTIDDSLPFIFNIALAQAASLLGSFFVLGVSSPQTVVLLLVPLPVVYYRLQKRYRCSSRELRRLDAVTQSPLFTHLSESIDDVGSIVIRAMGARARFERTATALLHTNQEASFASSAASQWLSFRLQVLGCMVVSCVGVSSVLLVQLKVLSNYRTQYSVQY